MSDENTPDNIDDEDDLLSDFNDLFPDESDDKLNELQISDDDDDLESLLSGLDSPPESDLESSRDEDDIDTLLDTLDASLDAAEADNGEAAETPVAKSDEPLTADVDDNLDSLLAGLEEQVEEITGVDGNDDDADTDDLDDLLDEMITESKPANERDLGIDDTDLDLSIDIDEEIDTDDVVSTEDDSAPADEIELSFDNDEADDTAEESDIDDLLSSLEDTAPIEEIELSIGDDDDAALDGEMDDLISAVDDSVSVDEDETVADSVAPVAAAAAAAAAVVTEAKPQKRGEPDEPSSALSSDDEERKTKEPSKRVAIATYLLLVIALIIAGGSLWMTLQAQQGVEMSNARLNKLQKQQELMQREQSINSYSPLIEQNGSSIRDLDLRINELSKMVDGPLSHMNANNNEEVIGQLKERILQLEEKLAGLEQELAKRPTVVAATTSPPLLIKSSESSTKPQKLWALNILSLSSRKGASEAINRLKKAGINASQNRFNAKDGKTWFRVRVTGFTSYEAAKSYAKEMPKVRGVGQTWVTPE